ncbi:MAG: DUF3426 domain-containing protein [Saccharospirillum sp.]
MPDSFITQCPHCGTSFRVKEEHLAIANGSVRCGACLQVFSAKNHLVNPQKTSASAQSQSRGKVTPLSPKPPHQPAPAAPASPAVKDTPPNRRAEPHVQPSMFEADDDDDADFIFRDESIEDEEFIFQDNDEDDRHDTSAEAEPDSELGEFSESFLNLDKGSTGHNKDPFQREKLEDETDDSQEQDESWAESILEELEREEKRADLPGKGSYSAARPDIAPSSTFALDEPEPQAAAFEAPATSHASRLAKQLSQEIDLDFSAEERLVRWRWLGAVLALLLLLTLGGQFAWLQKDTYAKMDQWRGLYETACSVLGCRLPAQVDIDQVRTSNVLVRDHRSVDGVKLLDAILTNRAAFRQPFPTLIIQYTDVNGELVADQAFTPDQYLRGEMTGSQLMPINTRIYVSIPIRDPGQRAVNYQLVLVQQPT